MIISWTALLNRSNDIHRGNSFVKKTVATLLAFTLVSAGPAQAAKTLLIPADTGVIVKLLQPIGSGTHKKGDLVKMEVAQDVYVEGKKVITAGEPVDAVVKDVAKRFIAGIGGYLKLEVDSVKSVTGTVIPLKFTEESQGKTHIWGVICTVVCCCIAIFIPGEDVKIEAGKLYNATTASNVEIQL
jgi:hypothetical protein